MKKPKTRRLAAIMFTDIVGYTALMQRDEQAAADVRTRHRQVFQASHEVHNGQIVQYFGDGTLSVFQSGVEAVACAIAIQKALREGEVVPLRIGLHIGDIVFDGTEIYGDGVNLASRIESMGVAGAILLSGKLNDELRNHSQISTQSLGRFELKNVARPVEIFAVTNEGIKVPVRSELKGKLRKQTKSIAVLPFVNMSRDEENEYMSDGMTEEIINALAKIKSLRVTSRTSSFYFKGKNIPIAEIGRELQVAIILEGSIRFAGNRMRITAQLIDVAEDYHFWSETFDRSVEDIFAVQDEISLLIADKLREHIGHFEIAEQLIEAPEIPVDIYQRYLKSRYHLLKMTKSEIDKGLSILEGIIEQQPHFALAYLSVHLGFTLLGTIGFMPAGEAFMKGQPFLDKAIELNPNLAETQLHLSYICFLQKWDLAGAYRHLRKSYEIRPTVEYYQSMASTVIAEGKFAAADNYIETALKLDPFSAINYHLQGYVRYTQEKYEPAIESFEKALHLNANFMASTLYKGQALLLMGRNQEALAFFENLRDEDSGDILQLGGTTLAHAALGNPSAVEDGMAKLEKLLQSDLMERAIGFLVMSHLLLGNEEQAIEWVEEAVEFRLPMTVYYAAEPMLKPLRSNSRFQTLMRQVLGETNGFDFAKRKYKQSLLDEALLERYREKLEKLMKQQKPYLDPNLSLRSLAAMMDIPPNHLSQLLNEGFSKNFSEFVNDFRLEAFKEKVADPAKRNMTILALALESGFNSNTVFNTYFKKVMGMTPREYWKKIG